MRGDPSQDRVIDETGSKRFRPARLVSKHLRLLREAGLVTMRIDTNKRIYSLRPDPLIEVDGWLLPIADDGPIASMHSNSSSTPPMVSTDPSR